MHKENLIHGETEIILKNPKTGLVDRVRSSNTFQSAVLAKALRFNGNAHSSPLGEDSSSAIRGDDSYKETLGGLLLFRDAITVGSSYMPAGNRMTGCGYYGGLNGGDPVERGSFNSSESSFSHDACTQVYDFTTSQANGRISCVSLTSRTAGIMGYGNPSGYKTASTHMLRNLNVYSVSPRFDDNNQKQRITIGNRQYVLWSQGENTLTIRKYDVNITEYSVFDGTYEEIVLDTTGMHTERVYDKPRLTWGYYRMFYASGKIYFTSTDGCTYSSSEPCYYWCFDPSNNSFTELTFNWPLATSFRSSQVSIAHGYLIFMNYSAYNALVFNLSTGAFVEEISGWISGPEFATEFHGGLIYIGRGYGGGSNVSFLYDPVNHTCFPINGVSGENNWIWYETENDVMNLSNTYYSRYTNYIFNSPFYLATINNLGTPVIKDATRTMKVFYRLERV